MISIISLLSSILAVQAISLPRQETTSSAVQSKGLPAYIACVTDAKISSLTSSEGIKAENRSGCSTSCSSSGQWDLAFFREDTKECYCSPLSDAPTSDEIVYATDSAGNCRKQDDASVEYLHSEYTFSSCLIPTLSPSTSNFTTSTPVECLSNCPNSSSSITVRPEYNGETDTFEYECGCYDSGGEVGGGAKMDCGFGIASVYARA